MILTPPSSVIVAAGAGAMAVEEKVGRLLTAFGNEGGALGALGAGLATGVEGGRGGAENVGTGAGLALGAWLIAGTTGVDTGDEA